VALGVPCRLRFRIFSTFGTTRVVDSQPNAPAAFTQEKSLVLIFRSWVDLRAHGFVGRNHRKKNPQWHHRGSIRLVAQRLNHYVTPDPNYCGICYNKENKQEPLTLPRRFRCSIHTCNYSRTARLFAPYVSEWIEDFNKFKLFLPGSSWNLNRSFIDGLN
jgi:hypothetical protein